MCVRAALPSVVDTLFLRSQMFNVECHRDEGGVVARHVTVAVSRWR
jgi:hypothetical protein